MKLTKEQADRELFKTIFGLSPEEIDAVVKKETVFKSLKEMCDKAPNYIPTLRADINPDLEFVAQEYNRELARRGIDKRAYLVTKRN